MAQDRDEKKTAGAFDIRVIIGALLGIYGIVLILVFAFAGDNAGTDTGGDKNDNLWTGLVMLAVGLIFLAWGWLRPVVVEDVPGKDVRGKDVRGKDVRGKDVGGKDAAGGPSDDRTPPAAH